jgi:N utilization substance protein B
MTNRRKIRELTMQVLFLWDSEGEADRDTATQALEDGSPDAETRRIALEWAGKAWAQRVPIDARTERVAPQWPPKRQPAVDRAIIRLAVWELTEGQTPPKVIIDEAIELARAFGTEQSAAFVNGVVDAIYKENAALTGGTV